MKNTFKDIRRNAVREEEQDPGEEGARETQDDIELDRPRREAIIRKFFINRGMIMDKEAINWVDERIVGTWEIRKVPDRVCIQKFVTTKGDNNEEKIHWIQREREQHLRERGPRKTPIFSARQGRRMTEKEIEKRFEEAFAGWEALEATKRSGMKECNSSKPD
jgi:hypothetical protein